jgi:hypothetical protein
MAEVHSIDYERRLRRQLRTFLAGRGPHRAVVSTLYDWKRKDWRPFLFGGLLRDILILGRRHGPRDVDVVIENGSSEELAEALHPYIKRRNRFGGFQLELSKWHFDVWPLHKTWAFVQNKGLIASPQNLPKTTFLNVEAIAVSLGENGEVGDIFEAGFFDAVRTKILDINLEDNPYPALAAVRALATAEKLRYSLSPRLGHYILDTEKDLGSEALVNAQDSHYGYVRFRRLTIQKLVRHVRRELSRSSVEPIRLHDPATRQLSLWHLEESA